MTEKPKHPAANKKIIPTHDARHIFKHLKQNKMRDERSPKPVRALPLMQRFFMASIRVISSVFVRVVLSAQMFVAYVDSALTHLS